MSRITIRFTSTHQSHFQFNVTLLTLACGILLLAATASSSRSERPQAPRWIEEPPAHVSLQQARSLLVPCSAEGEPQPELFWLKNGTRIRPNATNANFTAQGPVVLPNNSLFFNASDSHMTNFAGTYQCGARNSRGTLLSRLVRVVTFWSWNTKGTHCSSILTMNANWYEQDTVMVITCKIQYPWREHVKLLDIRCATARKLSIIRDNRVSSIPQMGELHVRNLTREDCWSYKCVANSSAVNDPCSVQLDVAPRTVISPPAQSVKPFFDPSRREIDVETNETVELPCVASASRPSTRTWKFQPNGGVQRDLLNDTKYGRVGTTSNLIIHRVQWTDAGEYTCLAENSFGSNKLVYHLTVRLRLRVAVRPFEMTVDLGGSRMLECDYSGSPVDEVQWLKDGEQLLIVRHGTNNQSVIERSPNALRIRAVNEQATTIEISNVTSADRGVYQCLVSNKLDSAQASASLVITAPVFLDDIRNDSTVYPGSEVVLRCTVTATPLPSVVWSLDGEIVNASTSSRSNTNRRLRVETRNVLTDTIESTLRIANVSVADAGEYHCVATANSRSVSSLARNLNVYGPVEAKPMQDVVAVGGETVLVHCKVVGFPVGGVSWYRDRVLLPADPLRQTLVNRSLRIKGVVDADRGLYVCVPRSADGQIGKNSSVNVIVKYTPSIKQESERTVKEGDSVTLLCDVNTGVSSILWLRNGALFHPTAGYTATQLQTGGNLAISQAKREHAGNYTCIASNDVGTANMTHALVVQVPAGFAHEPPKTVVMELNERRSIPCIASGFPTPSVQWRYYPVAYGEALGNDSHTIEKLESMKDEYVLPHRFVLPNGTLLIKGAREADSGKYLCIVDNNVGPAVSRSTVITVKIPVRFAVKQLNYSAIIGQPITLECRIKASDTIEVRWFHSSPIPRNGLVQSSVPIEKGLLSLLNISAVGRDDAGTYECRANNSAAADSQSHTLVVLDVPEPVRDIKTVGSPGSRSATIGWSPPTDNHSPVINYIVQFKLQGEFWSSSAMRQLVVPAPNTRAVIEGLQPASTYSVQVFANNSVGQSRQGDAADFTTAEEQPNGPPRNVTVSVDSIENPRSVRVRWLPPAREHRNGELRGYYVQWKECNSNSWQAPITITSEANQDRDNTPHECSIQSLSELKCYAITVQAFNAKGAGVKSDEVYQLTNEDLPKRPPQNILARAVTQTSFSVTWQTPQLDDLGGVPLGYRAFAQQVLEDEQETAGTIPLHTTSTELTFINLRPHTNYSVRVLLYNRIGPSDLSPPLFVQTQPARPAQPAALKLIPKSSDILIVSWLPPVQPNGVITHYELKLIPPSSGTAKSVRCPSQRNSHLLLEQEMVVEAGKEYLIELRAANLNLDDEREGPKREGRIFMPLTNLGITPKIASFGGSIRTSVGASVTLGCIAYGLQSFTISWTSPPKRMDRIDQVVATGRTDNSKVLNNVQPENAGTYTCTTWIGSTMVDSITYDLQVQNNRAVPQSPALFADWNSESKAMLRWLAPSNGGSRIIGYDLSVQHERNTLLNQRLGPDARTHLLRGLQCASRYTVQLRAENGNGFSQPTEVALQTNGTQPTAAHENELRREVNATFVRLWLRAFRANGCPIKAFGITYAAVGDAHSPLLNVSSDAEFYIVTNLQPATNYEIVVKAMSDAGSVATRLKLQTASFIGAQKLDVRQTGGGERPPMPTYLIVVFIFIVVLVIVLAVATILIVKRRTMQRKLKETSAANLRHDLSETVAFIGGSQRPSSAERVETVAYPKNGTNKTTMRQSSHESMATRMRRNANERFGNNGAPSLTDDEDDIDVLKKNAKKRMRKTHSLEKLEKEKENEKERKKYAEYGASKSKDARDKLLVNHNSSYDEYGKTKQLDDKRREQEQAAQIIGFCMNDPATSNGYAAYASRELNTLDTESTINPYAEYPASASHALCPPGGAHPHLQTQHSVQLVQSQAQGSNATTGSHTVLLQRGDSVPYACYYPGLQQAAQLHAAAAAAAAGTLTYGTTRCAHGMNNAAGANNTALRRSKPAQSCSACSTVSSGVPFACGCEMNNNAAGNAQSNPSGTILPALPTLNENAPSINDTIMTHMTPFYHTVVGASRFGSHLVRHHPMSNSTTTVSSANDELAQAYERAQRAPAQLSALLASEASSTVGVGPSNSSSDGQSHAPTDCPSEGTFTGAFSDLGIRQFTQMPPCPDEQRQATCEVPFYDPQKSRSSLYSMYGIAKRKGSAGQQQQPRAIPLKITAPPKIQALTQPRNAPRLKHRNVDNEQRKPPLPVPHAAAASNSSGQRAANVTAVRNEEPIYEDPDDVVPAPHANNSYQTPSSQPLLPANAHAPPDAQSSAFAKYDRVPKTPKTANRLDSAYKNPLSIPKVDFVPIRPERDLSAVSNCDADDDLPPPPPQPKTADTAALLSPMAGTVAGSSFYGPNSKESASGQYSSIVGDSDYSYAACTPNLNGTLTMVHSNNSTVTLRAEDVFPMDNHRKLAKPRQNEQIAMESKSNATPLVHRAATNSSCAAASQIYYSTIPSLPYVSAAEMADSAESTPFMQASSSSAASDRTVRHVPTGRTRCATDEESKIYSENIVV